MKSLGVVTEFNQNLVKLLGMTSELNQNLANEITWCG
jgi:hypothetical protein